VRLACVASATFALLGAITAEAQQPSTPSRPATRPATRPARSASAASAGANAPAAVFEAPQWAYPIITPPPPPPPADSVVRHRVPGSTVTMTMAEATNYWTAPDWFPDAHPPMPAAVRAGRRPEPRACGFCHLPDGRGAPENAALSGLPAEYIIAQVNAFKSGARLSANPGSPTNSMHRVAAAVLDEEVAEAARYFSGIKFVSRNRVLEVDSVPRTRIASVVYVKDGDGKEPIAGRLIEIPEDAERRELRDPTMHWLAYVPKGSLARGRRLVTRGPDGPATACAMCHGPKLQGVGLVPPIAGRPPSYILRQLINLRTGARHDAGSVPMQAVVARMSVDDMVGIAAYIGKLGEARR